MHFSSSFNALKLKIAKDRQKIFLSPTLTHDIIDIEIMRFETMEVGHLYQLL